MKQLLHTPPMWSPLLLSKIVIGNAPLILHMTKRQLSMRYRGSILGWIWSLAQPLMMLCVYAFVFGIIFKARWGTMPDGGTVSFAAVMFCGMATFNLFAETVNTSAPAILQNANLVKKVVFPLEIIPIVHLASTVVFGSIWFLLLFAGSFALGITLHATAFLLPVVLIPVLLLALGVAYFVSAASVYIRDIPPLMTMITQVLFFMTPIFYPLEMVPEKFRWLLYFNPLTAMVEQVRAVVLFGLLPSFAVFCLNLLVGFFFCRLGLCWFLKTKKGFADVL